MSQLRKFEIKPENGSIAVRNINAVQSNVWEYYPARSIKSIVPVYQPGFGTRQADNQRKNPVRYDDKFEFIINFHDENESSPIKYNIEDVDNQPTWTNDLAGLTQAVADINSWVGATTALGGATEATLQAVLTAIDAMRDYETRLVVDSDAPPVTWLEVRYWDEQDGTLGTPQYYQPGSTVAGTPTGAISYINPQTLLTTISADIASLNTKFTAVTRTPAMLRVTGAGAASVTAGKRRVSLFNAGAADATVLGATLKAGELVTFAADGEEDTLAAISYDALTSELLITTIV